MFTTCFLYVHQTHVSVCDRWKNTHSSQPVIGHEPHSPTAPLRKEFSDATLLLWRSYACVRTMTVDTLHQVDPCIEIVRNVITPRQPSRKPSQPFFCCGTRTYTHIPTYHVVPSHYITLHVLHHIECVLYIYIIFNVYIYIHVYIYIEIYTYREICVCTASSYFKPYVEKACYYTYINLRVGIRPNFDQSLALDHRDEEKTTRKREQCLQGGAPSVMFVSDVCRFIIP